MEVIKAGSKYFPLYHYLQQTAENNVTMTFQEIENLLGAELPESARRRKAFWSNRVKGAHQAKAWMNAGYHVCNVELDRGRITFEKPQLRYKVKKEGDTILWNGHMIRALRRFLALNQAEFSEILGVRQQTVSEWENQQYQPTRSRSKHLAIIAERAGFKYQTINEGEITNGS